MRLPRRGPAAMRPGGLRRVRSSRSSRWTVPIPSSIVSTAAGVLLGLWRGVAVVWIGMMLTCVLGYAFGSRASGAARRLVGTKSLDHAEHLVRRYGDWTIALCQLFCVG